MMLTDDSTAEAVPAFARSQHCQLLFGFSPHAEPLLAGKLARHSRMC
jgi:hypothetical protein